MAKRKKAKAKAVAKRKTKPVSKVTRTSAVSAAKKVRRAQIKILNERWSQGGWTLECDVNFEGLLISNVSVGTAEGFPPGGQAGEVYFPAGTDLQEKDQEMIGNAVLACYYGVEID
jgi:hypothetical protein